MIIRIGRASKPEETEAPPLARAWQHQGSLGIA